MYQIVTVPIPEKVNKAGVQSAKFPFDLLEEGQSFFVPNKDDMPPGANVNQSSTLANIATHCSRANRKARNAGLSNRYDYSKWPENNQFIQVWRVS